MDKLLLTPHKRSFVIKSVVNFGLSVLAVMAAHFAGMNTDGGFVLPIAFTSVVYIRELFDL